jgi:hypothetical protein
MKTIGRGERLERKHEYTIIINYSNDCFGLCHNKHSQDKNRYGNSKAVYERCLEQNSNDPSKCEALKRAYEADLKAYREECKSIPSSTTGFIEFGLGAPGIGHPPISENGEVRNRHNFNKYGLHVKKVINTLANNKNNINKGIGLQLHLGKNSLGSIFLRPLYHKRQNRIVQKS